MNAILRRLVLVVKVWMNALLAPAEDPRQVFEIAHKKQRSLLSKVRQAQIRVASSKQQLRNKTVFAREKLPQLEGQARKALKAGRENQARLALQLKQVATGELGHLEEQVEHLQQEEEVLTLVEQRLASQIEAFFARQEVLAARYSRAEAQVTITEALSGVSEELADLGLSLERAEDRTEQMQSRAAAIEELVDLGILESPALQTERAVLPELARSEDSEAVEEELEALKLQVDEG